jgi:hypothetical protein
MLEPDLAWGADTPGPGTAGASVTLALTTLSEPWAWTMKKVGFLPSSHSQRSPPAVAISGVTGLGNVWEKQGDQEGCDL